MNRKAAYTLAGAALLVAVLNFSSRGLGFIREVLFANYFGLGTDFDLYLVGAVLPITINIIILSIAQNYFIPQYYKTKQNSPGNLYDFFNNSFWFFTFAGLFTGIILFFSAPGFLTLYVPNVSEKEFSTIISIFNLFLITIPINAATSILISYLQAEYQFKAPALSQIIINILVIGLLIGLTESTGIFTIPFAFIIGMIAQLVYLMKYCPVPKKIILFRKDIISQLIKNNAVMFLSIVLIESISQLYLLSDRYFYGSVETGGIAALNYSYNLFLLPISILSYALTTVLFPRFSQTLNSADKNEFRKNFSQSLEVTLLLFIPIAVLFVLSGEIIIRILFERGNFTPGATNMTFSVLRIYSFSLPFYAVYAILNKIIYSAGKINSLLIVTLCGIIIKIAANYLLVGIYQQEGLAMGTVFSYLFFFVCSILIIRNYTGKEPFFQAWKIMVILLINVLLSYFISSLVSSLFFPAGFSRGLFIMLIFIPAYYLSLRVVIPNMLDSTHKLLLDLIRRYFPVRVI